ncbi:MAG: helicase-associated domain-containing protein [Candidatus Nanopelagicaceae bacterium]
MSVNSFADELRARSDEAIAELFQVRPDLLSPVPTDLSALSARANSTPSLMRALESLNKFQLEVLTSACILNEPFAKSELVSISIPQAGEELLRLWAAALVYKDGTKFRLPGNLRHLIGDEPAGLGPQAQKKIDFKALKEIPADSAAVLERLTWGPPRGQVGNIKAPGKAIGWLLENNYLAVMDSKTVVLPRDVGMHLRNGKVFKDYSPVAKSLIGTPRKQKDIDRAAIANISNFLRWCEELAHNWSDEPPMALRSGGLGIRDLKRSADHLGVDENCVAFVAEVLYLGGLIVIDTDDQILPTNSFDIWMSRSLEERWSSLVNLWLETSRVSGLVGKAGEKNIAPLGPELDRAGIASMRKVTLKILSQNLELDPEIKTLQEIIAWQMPQRFSAEYIEWTLREAEWLGLTGQGALSEFGSAFLNESADLGVESALPKPVDHILIQADNSAIAPGPLTVELANMIGTIADIESRGGASVYRFSESSIRRGLDHGQTGEQIKDFLKKTSKTPVPQPLEYLINDVAKRHGRLRVGSAQSYLRCEDEGLVTQILHDKKIESLRLRKLAPQVLVCDVEPSDVIATLREANYLPAAENANGILISAPAIRRAKSRPRPPRVLSETHAPSEIVIKAAVRTLRTGEKASSHKPREVPRTTANETLDLLHQYIEEQASLTIGYADTNGGVSNRLIDPISISLGTLLAKDHATGEMQSFRIPRITGVSPAK